MAFQLQYGEERVLREQVGRQFSRVRGAEVELHRAYDALIELLVINDTAVHQPSQEYGHLYESALDSYNNGDLEDAELTARAVRHLCRAAWFDAKIKYLEGNADKVSHLPGLIEGGGSGIDDGIHEVEGLLSRMKLTGLADRFAGRARKHVERIQSLHDSNSLLADTFMKAAYEYCLATEVLQRLEYRAAA